MEVPPRFHRLLTRRCLSSLPFVIFHSFVSGFDSIIQFDPSEKEEIEKFKAIVNNRNVMQYYPSYRAAELVGVSGRALGKLTSSFMVVTSDGQKVNLGLSIKFEAKSMKVIDYSRKEGRSWEYSQKALDLIVEYKVCGFRLTLFPLTFFG